MTSPSQKNQWAELFDAARPLEERTALAFAADGPLARRQTNFTPREGQLAFAQAVAEAIQNKETLLAEAGTGTGKSFAYLVPALLSGSTVVISTAGKPLQDQLFNKDIPALSAALGSAGSEDASDPDSSAGEEDSCGSCADKSFHSNSPSI